MKIIHAGEHIKPDPYLGWRVTEGGVCYTPPVIDGAFDRMSYLSNFSGVLLNKPRVGFVDPPEQNAYGIKATQIFDVEH